MTDTKIIINAATGEQQEVPLSAEEQAELDARRAQAVTDQQSLEAKLARRQAIIAKGVPSKAKINSLPIDDETKGVLLTFRALIKALLLGEDEV